MRKTYVLTPKQLEDIIEARNYVIESLRYYEHREALTIADITMKKGFELALKGFDFLDEEEKGVCLADNL